ERPPLLTASPAGILPAKRGDKHGEQRRHLRCQRVPLQRRLLQVQPAPDQSDRALRIRQLRQPAGGESPLLPELRKEVKAPRKKFPRRASVPGWAAGEFWRKGAPFSAG